MNPAEAIVSSSGVLLCLFMSLLLNKGKLRYEYMIFSCFLVTLTLFGRLNVNMLSLVLVLGLFLMYGTMCFTRPIIFKLVLFFLSSIIFCGLSITHEATILEAFFKAVKVFAIFLPLFFINDSSRFDVLSIIKSFVIITPFFGVIYLWIVGWDNGIYNTIRFSGFLNDSNYFALTSLLFLMYLDFSELKSTRYKAALVLFIFASQSFSIIILLVLYVVLNSFKDIKYNAYFWSFAIAISYILLMFYLSAMLDLKPNDDYQTSAVSYKLNSIIFRLMAQLSAVSMMIDDTSIILFGYGGGKSIEVFGKVLHNSYMQMLFDNGVFLLFLVIFSISYFAKRLMIPFSVLIVLLFVNLIFDAVFMFYITFFFMCFSRRKVINSEDISNNLHRSIRPRLLI
ncbi:hypothetical protein NOK72_25025 [Vibrio parahaemolyticus]|uniref:hypothetical protein n=1 Tax=Vibrio parahaemolyticus TaxID=670 RepID=UPI00226BBBD6|nr:hypothetical protein [Vibrio parahaemolyticus]MCX8824527.1 hypothetical protein [Vibrio parahaemolyticus]MCX8835042.1 hypothetical protein [Vibrio parahaemolyticus]HCG9120973.1 hypothetical protein [Vibrio parahaemolyticus]